MSRDPPRRGISSSRPFRLVRTTSSGSCSPMPKRWRTIWARAQWQPRLRRRGTRRDARARSARKPVDVVLELPGQSGLADAGRTHHRHEPGAAPLARSRGTDPCRRRSSLSRPTSSASSPSPRLLPREPATARSARQTGTGSALPFTGSPPASAYEMAAAVAARVVLVDVHHAGLGEPPGCARRC